MPSPDAMTKRATAFMFTLLLGSLLIGMLVPIYTDEVGWRFQMSRYVQDHGLDRAIGESCGPSSSAAPPLFMLPVRLFSAGVTALFSDPLAVRVAGVGFAILALFLLRDLVRRVAPDPARRATLELLTYALLGLGVLPFLLVLSRPEQPLWLAMLVAMILALRSAARADAREPRLVIGAITVLALIALSYHLKTLIYLPVFLLAIVVAGYGSRRFAVRAAAIVVILACTWFAYRYWSGRFACPGDPIIAARAESENILASLKAGGLQGLIAAAPHIATNMLPQIYIDNALPASFHMSAWLPPAPVGATTLRLWRLSVTFAWFVALASGVLVGILAAIDRKRIAPILIGLALVGCSTAWAALQNNKNAYESSLYLPTLVLAIVLFWSAMDRDRDWLRGPLWIIVGIAAISQLLLIGWYGAYLRATTTHGGYIDGQPFSVSAFAYPRAQVLAAGAKCGIVPRPGLQRVLVDDMTYFAYAQSYYPMHRLGVLSTWNGSIADPLAWMRERGSPGAVIGCRYLPPAMLARAIATGTVCCMRTR